MVHVGNNNFVNVARILSVSSPKAISVRRALKTAIDNGLMLDFTGALETKSLIICDNGVVIRSPIRTIDVERRINTFDNAIELAP